MWQTETGGPVFGNPYGMDLLPIKPGSATIPLPGIEAAVVTLDGEPCAAGEKGIMVIRRPFPGLTPRLWGEPERYGRDYWERIPGRLLLAATRRTIDEDGYVWFGGRADEIIKIAGHRIGTIEVESACLRMPPWPSAASSAGPTTRAARSSRRSSCSRTARLDRGELKQALLDTVRTNWVRWPSSAS